MQTFNKLRLMLAAFFVNAIVISVFLGKMDLTICAFFIVIILTIAPIKTENKSI